MNKYRLLLLLLLANLGFASAQTEEQVAQPVDNYTFKWGPESQEAANSQLDKIIATDAEGFYIYREHRSGVLGMGSKKVILEYHSKALKLVRSRELDLKYKGKELEFKDFIMLGGRRLYMVTYFYNEKLKTTYLFAQKINPDNFILEGDILKLDELVGSNSTRDDLFNISSSKDSSKMLVSNHTPSISKGLEEFTIHIFDPEMKELGYRDVVLPYRDDVFTAKEYQIDNAGNAYLSGIVFDKLSGKKKGLPNYGYSLFAYPLDTSRQEHEFKITLTDKFITDLTFKPTENGQMICSGFYSDKSNVSIKGTCFIRINLETNKTTAIETKEFDFEFLTAHLSNKNKIKAQKAVNANDKQNEAELPNYALDKLIPRSDGGAILIAEQFYIETRYSNNYNNQYTFGYGGYNPYRFNNDRVDYYFHYNDIIVVNIRPNGEIQWAARIPKHQESVNDKGYNSSYAMSVIQDKLCFVYNDDPRNLDPNKKKLYATSADNNSIVVLTEINKEGQVSSKPLFNNAKGQDVVTRPKVCRQIGRKEMIIYGERGRAYRFAKVVFN
jgi:hypothetical protein